MNDDANRALCEREIIQHLPMLRAFVRRFERDPEKGEDLVQDVVVKALSHLDQFTYGTSMKSWLFTIARNTFCTQFGTRKRMTVGFDECVFNQLKTPPAQEWAIRWSEFEKAFDDLGPRHREALVFVVFEGQSYEMAAEQCGCAVGTIKSRVNRARAQLSTVLN